MPPIVELHGVFRALADGVAAVEGAISLPVRPEDSSWVDAHRGVEPLARQLHVALRADAPVLHSHRVLCVPAVAVRNGGLVDS